MFYSTEESMEQSAAKDGQITVLEDELVGYSLFVKHSFQSEHYRKVLEDAHSCYCCSQDRKSKSVESLKGKIDVTEVRVEELTAELSRKTEEAQRLKVERYKWILKFSMKKDVYSTV